MLYIKDKRVSHYIAEEIGEVFYDSYNFFFMTHNPQAVRGLIDFLITQTRQEPFDGDEALLQYSLSMDCHSNMATPYYDSVIEKYNHFFSTKGWISIKSEAPLRLTVQKNFTLEEITELIDDPDFRSLNDHPTFYNWLVEIID